MTYREELIELADGRSLEVATLGSPSSPKDGHLSIFMSHLDDVAAALQAS
jgi:hypothetical protein